MKSKTRPSYRVELRSPTSIKCIAFDLLCDGHRRSLDPFVSKLTLERIGGTLVLLEGASGSIVAKRKVTIPFGDREVPKNTGPTTDQDRPLQRMHAVLIAEAS